MRKITVSFLVIGSFALGACTPPSKEGLQSSLKASLPVDAVITFE